jgi:isopenicillin N synthase-like dioxygenase
MPEEPAPSVIDARIPVIDLKVATAEEFVGALRESSCVFVVGHGIEPDLRRRMDEVSRAFFQRPRAAKELVRWPGEGVWHGWMPDGGSSELAADAAPDLVEWYQVNDLDRFTLWPDEPDQLRDIWTAYYRSCAALASTLMSMIAEVLDLPAHELPSWTNHQFANLAVNHYPPLASPPRPKQVRLSTHTDECGLTLLTANNAPGGLEVRLPGTGRWTPVVFPPDAYLVQVGDLLARWTNRLIRANVHRVVNPPLELMGDQATERNTLVFFHLPSLDSKVVPAPSCVAKTGGTALPTLNTYEFILKRQKAYVADVPISVDAT